MPTPSSTENASNHGNIPADGTARHPIAQSQGNWSRQNIHWVGLAAAWWIGSLAAWWGTYSQSWLMTSSDLWSQESFSDASISGTGIFILLISATLRLPAMTATVSTTPIQDLLVWLLGMGANINWLGMQCLRTDSLWTILPLIVFALVIEYWLFSCMSGEGSDSTQSSSGAEDTRVNFAVQGDSQIPTIFNFAESEFGGRVHRTMMDRTDEDGARQLSGDIFIEWQDGQKFQTQVVGFQPAFDKVPSVEFETDNPDTVVRCLNCTQTGMRLELKRTGRLVNCHWTFSWAATVEPNACDSQSKGQSLDVNPARGLA